MRILVLGGTAWLSGQIATRAVADGHEVTCLARGESGDAPEGVGWVRADRDREDAYDEVSGQHWDVAFDVSRQPGHVRRATAALAERCGFFVFVSTGNVYADHATPGKDESAALLPPLEGDVMASMETYGEAKVACEFRVLEVFGDDRSLIARSGLIGGPGDTSDRTGYWPLRFYRPVAADGSVLVPDVPDLASQVVDVRDLAAWLVAAGCDRRSGIFNATGEAVPLREHLAAARQAAGHTGPLVAASEEWLTAQGVEPWMGERSLPLWVPGPDYAGFNALDSSAARAEGLTHRPLTATLADVLAWELANDPDRPRRAGLGRDDEAALLDLLDRP